MTVSAQSALGSSLGGANGDHDEASSNNRPPSEQLYESASIIYGPVGYLGDGGKPSWFQNGFSSTDHGIDSASEQGCWGFSEDDANGDDDHDGGDDESFYAAAGGLGPRLAPMP